MLFNLQSIHLEISSKCTLKCPRCPRTELKPDAINREFSLDEFKVAFPPPTLATLVKQIMFSGDIGDPIYATEFIDIIRYIKSVSTVSIIIVTNGSYRKKEWWAELGSLLTKNDQVKFSVDGWDHESNNLYRVNSHWDSIMEGMKTLRESSPCYIAWSCIYFKFNENKIPEIEALAKRMGVDLFQTVKSSKFDHRYLINGVDPLKPSTAFVDGSGLYERTNKVFNNTFPIQPITSTNAHPWAKCLNWSKDLFVNVDGYLYPCPWFNSGYHANDFVERYKDQLNIKKRSIEEVLNDPLWEDFMARINTMPLEICKVKCRECR